MSYIDIFNTDKKYQIIYADPPWSFKVWSKDTGNGRSAESHYKIMNTQDIGTLPVSKIAGDKNAILFIWATFPNLQDALKIIKAWEFDYKTCAFVWVKANRRTQMDQLQLLPISAIDDFVGMGYWTRANAEICLLATRGHIKRISAAVRQIVYAPIGRHSEKPKEVRDRIVELCGNLPRIELFARQSADGWDCWGDEAPNSGGNDQNEEEKTEK